MATKMKRKLKKKFKISLLLIFFIMAVAVFSYHGYNTYLYHQTTEYELTKKGYSKETINLLRENLSIEHFEYILKEERIDYIQELVGAKYYLDKNFYEYLEYYEKNDKLSFIDVIALVNTGSTKEWYTESVEASIDDYYSILINKFHSMPSDIEKKTIKTFSATYAYGTVKAEEECYKAFITMANAAKNDGITLILTSGYRTNEDQTKIYNNMKSKYGLEYAEVYAARPGYSEHETGLALDMITYNASAETFKDTEAYTWLQGHAFQYGFIERYEEGKEYITGYSAESWHYRYLGVELATKVHDEGITYDEYYAFYMAN